MNGNSIEVSVTISFDDYCAFVKESTKKAMTITYICIALFFVFFTVRTFIDVGFNLISVIVSGLLLLTMGIVLLICSVRPSKRLKKNLLKQYESNKLLQIQQIFTITPNGIEKNCATGLDTYKWDDFYKYKEFKLNFLIFFAINQCFIIPKKYFTDPDTQIPLLREYLKNIPPIKKK